MSEHVVLDEGALRQLLTSETGPVGQYMGRLGVHIESVAKQNATGSHEPGEYGRGLGPNVITGRLRGSITWRLEPAEGSLDLFIGTNVEYALFVELGTVNMPGGYPYLRPALDAARFV